MKIKGLPVIEVDESEEITVAVWADDLLEGDTANPKQHPIAIALRRQDDVDDARVTKNETLVRRGKKWFRHDAPNISGARGGGASISYFLDASPCRYAPKAIRATPPTKATPKILVSQKISSITKYRPARSITTELINMLVFLMLPLPIWGAIGGLPSGRLGANTRL